MERKQYDPFGGSNMDIESIWIKYYSTKEKELKNILIEHYIELVKIVSGRMYN